MKKHIPSHELSAYLDGEHDRPADVQKHLQQCAECARRHVAMQKLSAHIKALPEPEVTFGFAGRVMRAIEHDGAAPAAQFQWRFWTPIGAGLAAAVALLVSVFGISAPSDRVDVPVAQTPAAATGTAPVMNLAGRLGPDGTEVVAVEADRGVALASAVATRPVPEEFFTGADYTQTIFALNDSEKEVLLQLLGSSVLDEHMM